MTLGLSVLSTCPRVRVGLGSWYSIMVQSFLCRNGFWMLCQKALQQTGTKIGSQTSYESLNLDK
jgi:hypothetical protein